MWFSFVSKDEVFFASFGEVSFIDASEDVRSRMKRLYRLVIGIITNITPEIAMKSPAR